MVDNSISWCLKTAKPNASLFESNPFILQSTERGGSWIGKTRWWITRPRRKNMTMWSHCWATCDSIHASATRCGAHWAKSRNLVGLFVSAHVHWKSLKKCLLIEDDIPRKIKRILMFSQNRKQLLSSDIGILNSKSHTQFGFYQIFHFKKYSSSRPLEPRKKKTLANPMMLVG